MTKTKILPILSENPQIVAKTIQGDYVMLRFDGVLFVRMRRGKTSRVKKKPNVLPSFMPTPLLNNEDPKLVHDTYNNAVKTRQMGAYLDTIPNDAKAAQQWHLIADRLFEAVELFDKLPTEGNHLPVERNKQKTM